MHFEILRSRSPAWLAGHRGDFVFRLKYYGIVDHARIEVQAVMDGKGCETITAIKYTR